MMIEARGLSKRYGDLVAVDDVSFSVAKGEVVGFLGPNGAGKRTTMRILTGFLPATAARRSSRVTTCSKIRSRHGARLDTCPRRRRSTPKWTSRAISPSLRA